jgi:DNA polymerase III delta subunit
VPKKEFAEEAVPPFDSAPSVIAIEGKIPFFVEEAASRARERLAGGDVEVLRFGDEAPPGTVAEALLNRSLFSPKRLVEIDISRLLGTDSPGELAESAVQAWERGSPSARREAFRHVRRLLSAVDMAVEGNPEEAAAGLARKIRKKDLAEPLAAILREMPEERDTSGATLTSTLRLLLERSNDGLVALLTASDPPQGSELVAAVAKAGLLLSVRVSDDRKEVEPALRRLAAARAREREVRIDPDAVSRLLLRTDARPEVFGAELEKLFDWAGEGGQVRAADVGDQVADEASEDFYQFMDFVGMRDAGEALKRLERMFSGREVRAGKRSFDPEEEGGWPQIFLGMLTSEIRRMLLIRARLDEPGAPAFDARMDFRVYQRRVAPFLDEPIVPFGRSPFGGRAETYPFYKAARGAARFTSKELARSLSRAADVDVKLKNSAPVLETLTAYVGELIAGH